MKKHDLLRKTELKIDKIDLHNANLTDIAATAAKILGLEQNEVLVVDFRDSSLTLDILNTCVNAYNIVGKKQQLLHGLDRLPGVSVSAETSVFSDGMLGWIDMDQGTAVQALRRSELMASEILQNISRRVLVFSTSGQLLRKWEMPAYDVGKPEGICVFKDGRIAVTDTHYHRVVFFDTLTADAVGHSVHVQKVVLWIGDHESGSTRFDFKSNVWQSIFR